LSRGRDAAIVARPRPSNICIKITRTNRIAYTRSGVAALATATAGFAAVFHPRSFLHTAAPLRQDFPIRTQSLRGRRSNPKFTLASRGDMLY